MRIIRGKYGRRRFRVPSTFKARPTTDFAKENLFNVIENILDIDNITALDLFSGTGSISFELLSRGSKFVTAVECNIIHASFIQKVSKELDIDNFQLIKGDVFRYLRKFTNKNFDFIFADPPYALPELASLPELVFKENILKDGGVFILEHPKQYDFSLSSFFSQIRTYGSVNFSIFIKEAEKTDA